MRPRLSAGITFLPTQDLGETRRFYEGLLGLELALDQGTCLIFHISGGAYWGFCASEEPMAEPENVILTLVTDDVDEWHDALLEAEIDTDDLPRLNEKYQIYHFFAKDPNGYRLEIQKFLDDRWIDSATDEDQN